MLASREGSSRELVEMSLRRIATAQPTLNAFRVVREEEALSEAEAADERLVGGEAGAAARRAGGDQGRRRPGRPHHALRLRRRASRRRRRTPSWCGGCAPPGRSSIGKTNAPEVGQWPFTESPAFGATRNPWSPSTPPVAPAAAPRRRSRRGWSPGAIGSDGAGSVRIPAAWTGLVGLKPQRGRISTWPDAEAFNGLACFGPLTRSVGDAALLLDAVAGNVPGDATSRPPRRQPSPRSPPAAAAAAGRALLRHPFGVPDEARPRDPRRDRGARRAARRSARPRGRSRRTPLRPGRPRHRAARDGRRARLAARSRARPRRPGAAHPRPRAARPRAHGPPLRLAAPPSRRCGGASAASSSAATSSSPRPRAAPAADRRPRRPRLLGDQHRGQRRLPLRLRLERDRLAGPQRAGRAHRRRPADRRPAARPRKRRGDAAGAGGELEAAAGGEWTERRPCSA